MFNIAIYFGSKPQCAKLRGAMSYCSYEHYADMEYQTKHVWISILWYL